MRKITALTGVAGLVAGAALVVASPSAVADETVPPEWAGAIEVFGSFAGSVQRESYPVEGGLPGPWVGVGTAGTDANLFAISSSGALERVKSNGNTAFDVPAALEGEHVVSAVAEGTFNSAVTEEGTAVLWGSTGFDPSPTVLDNDALGGTPVQVAPVANYQAAVLLDTGQVSWVSYRTFDSTILYEEYDLPDGSVVEEIGRSLAAGVRMVVARLASGGALMFRSDGSEPAVSPPAEVAAALATDPLVDIATAPTRVVGVTQSGAVYTWSPDGTARPETDAFPAGEVAGGKVVEVAATGSPGSGYLARTDAGQLISWAAAADVQTDMKSVAAELSGPGVARIAGGAAFFRVITGPGPIEADPPATIASSGDLAAPKVGDTLTGAPATFTGEPDEIVNEWLVSDTADGEPTQTIPAEGDSPTLTLTADHANKWIRFSSTANRGTVSATSVSNAVGPVAEQVIVNPPVPGDTPECQAAKSAASAAQAALGAAQAKAAKAKTKLKKAKKAKKPAAKVKKLKAKLKKAKQAQKAAAAAAATANANVTTKCN